MVWVLLALVIFCSLSSPSLAHWHAPNPVVVYDYTSPRWAGIVEAQVNDYNAKRPAGSRALVYSRQPDKPCTGRDIPGKKRTGVVVCAVPVAGPACLHSEARCGMTWQEYGKHRTITRSIVTLEDSDDARGYGGLVCHELVHAISLEYDGPHDRDSCMRGNRSDFGAWDIDRMSQALNN